MKKKRDKLVKHGRTVVRSRKEKQVNCRFVVNALKTKGRR